MTDLRVASWSELHDTLFEDSWRPEIARYRSRFALRGLGRSDYDLQTRLMNLGGDYAGLEHHLIRNFKKYAYAERGHHDSIWHWLALAQHHGLPTRLLDWTYSPYVALHFATQAIEDFDRDGAVWCVHCVRTNALLTDQLQRILQETRAEVFTVEMLDQVAHDLDTFDALAPEPFLAFFEPPSLDARIVNQFALFSVLSSPTQNLGEWLRTRPTLYRKIIIPAEMKWEIRDKLDQANINERVLFPGLDGLCSWLRRHYVQRPGRAPAL